MKKITLFAAILFSLACTRASAQEVEAKSSRILLDGKEILRYDKINNSEISFYSLKDDEELVMFKFNNNGTVENMSDDFFTLNFLKERIKVRSKDISHISVGLSGVNKMIKKIAAWLLKEKVVTADGAIDKDHAEIFYDKYNEEDAPKKVIVIE